MNGDLLSSPEASTHRSFGVYIHWPFCASKCPYCDFNSHVSSSTIDELRFLNAYKTELSYWAQKTDYEIVDTIFFGGGTPSLMSPELVKNIINEIAKHWTFAEKIEINLEANPQSVDARNFAGFAESGVNRVSIGVQSFDDMALKWLGRLHASSEARDAINIARSHFDRFSFDLIYALPNQSAEMWRRELQEALDLAPKHLSLYQLTIEPDTPFMALHKSGKLNLPAEEVAVEFYEIAQEECARAGLSAYEVSNHALPGEEARHNLIYWRYQDYLGIGAGAHGRVTVGEGRFATVGERFPSAWLEKVEMSKSGGIIESAISLEQQALEMILMGLRLSEGVSLTDLALQTGHGIGQIEIDELQCSGLLQPFSGALNEKRIRTTERGRLLLNHVAGKLAEGVTSISL